MIKTIHSHAHTAPSLPSRGLAARCPWQPHGEPYLECGTCHCRQRRRGRRGRGRAARTAKPWRE